MNFSKKNRPKKALLCTIFSIKNAFFFGARSSLKFIYNDAIFFSKFVFLSKLLNIFQIFYLIKTLTDSLITLTLT